MNISSSSAIQQQPYIQKRQDTGGWPQDFACQQGGMVEQPTMGPMPVPTNTQFRYSPMSEMAMASQYSGFAGQQAEMSNTQQKQLVETFDEEAEQCEMEPK
jgi:hypothetical protein